MVAGIIRLDRIRARVCCNSNHFEFQFNSNFFSPLSDLKKNLTKDFGHKKHMGALPFDHTNQDPLQGAGMWEDKDKVLDLNSNLLNPT